jgi:hypothetical protein
VTTHSLTGDWRHTAGAVARGVRKDKTKGWGRSLVIGYRDIEPPDVLRVFIAEMEVVSTRMTSAQKALGDSFLHAQPGYQDISAQISSALTPSVAALEEARRKLEELKPQNFREGPHLAR